MSSAQACCGLLASSKHGLYFLSSNWKLLLGTVTPAATYATNRRSSRSRTSDSKPVSPPPDKELALSKVIDEINFKFGAGTLMKLGAKPAKVETISTGSLFLDLALGGGLPRGRIIEIYGPEATGKTTLALHALAEVQKAGGVGCLIDAEHAFDATYGQRLGLDIDKLLVSQPMDGDSALDLADNLARSGAVDVIVIDSVAALVPKSEIQGDVGQPGVGVQARLMSQALRRLAPDASKMNCTIIFVNQIRQKVGVIYGNPETTPGGLALKFYSSVRIEVRRKETLEDEPGQPRGVRVKAKVVKNKVAPPYRLAEFDIIFGSGIDRLGSVLDCATACNVVVRRGAYYYFGDKSLGQGKERTLQALAADATLQAELRAAIHAKISEGSVALVVDDSDADGEASEEGAGQVAAA